MRAGLRRHLHGMYPPIFVRELSGAERDQPGAALRAASAFTVRRARIVLLSAAGRRPRAIAQGLCCAVQTARDAIRVLNAHGLAALSAGSSRPKSAAPVLGAAELGRLRAILHQPPRAFGHPRGTWTLALLSSFGDEGARGNATLSVEGEHGMVEGGVEVVHVAERAVGQVVALQVAPGTLDVVQLRRVLREPLDREPGPRGQRLPARLARVDRAVVERQHHRPILAARRRAVVPIEPRQQGDEVGGALGGAGEDDQLAAGMVEHAEERALLRLPRRLDPEVGAASGPAVGEIGVGQRLRLVPEQQVDVASPRLLPQEPEAQSRVVDRPRVLPALERVPRPAPAVAPFRSTALR